MQGTSPVQCTHLTTSSDLPEFSVLWVPRSVPRNRISIRMMEPASFRMSGIFCVLEDLVVSCHNSTSDLPLPRVMLAETVNIVDSNRSGIVYKTLPSRKNARLRICIIDAHSKRHRVEMHCISKTTLSSSSLSFIVSSLSRPAPFH